MKKLLFITTLLIGFSQIAKSQEIGIRFGDALGGKYAVDGIFALGDFNRIHADLAFGDGFGVEALYDFLYRPLSGEAFYWYVGAGVSLGSVNDNFKLGIAGEIGLEYHFNGAPIALGIDWRPC